MEKAIENNPFKNSGIFKQKNFIKKFGIGGGVLLEKNYFEEELKKDKLLEKFYSGEGRFFEKGNFVNLKGTNQVLPGLDKSLNVQEKIDILEKELKDFIDFFENFDENNINDENLDLYIGIFSAGKNALLTLFNAIVSSEKLGEYNLENTEYIKNKYILKSNLSFILDNYYNLILEGKVNYNDKKEFDLKENLGEVLEYITKNYYVESFSRSELLNPLVILGFSYNIVQKYPNTDIILSMPAGGTELGFLQKFLFKKIINKEIKNIIVPISIHSVKDLGKKPDFSKLEIFSYSKAIFKIIKNKNVLIIDDNSATGGTLQRSFDFLDKYNPKSLECYTAEADLRRIELKLFEEDKKNIASENIFENSVNITPVSKKIKPKNDLNEIGEQRLLKKFFIKKIKEAKEKNDQISLIKYKVKLDLIENEISKKDLENKDNITSFKGTFLSNFYPVEIEYNGKKFPSTEHAYFYFRYDFEDLKEKLKQNNNLIFKIIKDDLEFSIKNEKFFEEEKFSIENIDKYFLNKEISPNFLKRLSQKLEMFSLTTKGYSRDKLTKMIELSLIKYKNPELQKKLLATGDNLLIEGNDWGDKFWGVDIETGKGNNLLGRILMQVRDFYRKKK